MFKTCLERRKHDDTFHLGRRVGGEGVYYCWTWRAVPCRFPLRSVPFFFFNGTESGPGPGSERTRFPFGPGTETERQASKTARFSEVLHVEIKHHVC